MIKKTLLLTLFTITFISCKRKESTTWDVDINAPVIKTSLSITNLLPDSVLTINADSSVILSYQYQLNSFNTDSIFTIPDTTIKAFYNAPFSNSVTVAPGFQFANAPSINTFDYGSAKIEEIKVKSGKIKYKLISQINEKTIYTYQILKSKDINGNLFKKTITVPAGTVTNPAIVQGEFSLANYTLDMTGVAGNLFNTLETKVSVVIDPNGSPVAVSKLDSVFIENSTIQLKPYRIKGYLGTSEFSEGPNTSNFNVFNKITDGTIDLDLVDISLTIKNYIGADAQLKISELKSINNNTSNTILLSHSLINSWINISRASLINNNIMPNLYTYTMNNSNSNIDLFIENLPNQLQYAFEAKLNPLGNIANGNDFLFTKNTIDVDFNINIPLNFIANNLTLVDTINFNVNGESNPINSTLFTLIADNGFPFDAYLQLYILDNNGVICDSVFINNPILSAQTNISNIVTQSTITKLESVIPVSKMKKINTNSKMILKVIYNTNSSTHTQIYSHYKLDVKLITDMNYTVTIK